MAQQAGIEAVAMTACLQERHAVDGVEVEVREAIADVKATRKK